MGKKQKYFWTPAQDEILRKRYDSRTETINALAAVFGYPRWEVRHRAKVLGVARVKEPRWTEEEEEHLRKYLSTRSIKQLAKELGRSLTAIWLKKKRLGIRKTDDGYTLRGLCEALGVDHHKVEYWVAQGWLKKRTRGIDRKGVGDYWYVSDEALRKFICSHPEEIDLRRVEKFWFIDLLAGVKVKVKDFEGIPDPADVLAEVE